MPNEKVSLLPAATLPLSGSELVVMNQGSTTTTAPASAVAYLYTAPGMTLENLTDVHAASAIIGQTLTMGASGFWVPTTPASGSGGSSTLAADTDVSITSPTNGQALTYNSSTSQWNNSTITSSGSGGGGSSTLGGLSDVNSTGVSVGEYLGFTSTPPATRRQGVFADISGTTITVPLTEPALAGSLLIAYAALDQVTPPPSGFTLLTMLQPSAGLGNSVSTMFASGGETSIVFSGVANNFGGCTAYVEEWVNAANITIFTTTSAYPTSPTTLSGIVASDVVVISRNLYNASAGGGFISGWTNYQHVSGSNAASLEIYEQVATSTSASITIPAQTGGDSHYSGYIMFAISSTAPSAFVFTTPPAIAGIDTAYPSSPVIGQLFYRSDLTSLAIWSGSAWVVV